MLAELSIVRNDSSAPAQFLKAVLQGRYARLGDDSTDMSDIDNALNLWVRRNEEHLGLQGRADRFHDFVDQLLRLATRDRTFSAASQELKEGLAEVFYNVRNGLDGQMAAIFAAIDPQDVLAEAKEKARLISAYLDRSYVLRILTDLPVHERDLMETVCVLLPGLRECRSAQDVSGVLAQHVALEAYDSPTLDGFGLRAAVTAVANSCQLSRSPPRALRPWGVSS